MRRLLVFALCGLALCLVGLAIVWPYRMLTDELKLPPPDVALQITAMGCHWRYRYETPRGPVEIDPARTPCTDAACRVGLEPERAAVLPVGKSIRLIVASQADAPQDLSVRSLGLRVTAVPGAIREAWVKAERVGLYPSSVDARCEKDRAGLAIAFRAVGVAEWTEWLEGLSPERK